MLKLLALAAAGAVGTLARCGLSGWVQRLARETFPWGTLAANLAGCFAIGVVMALVRDRQMLSPELQAALPGPEGFCARSRIHTARILRLSEDLPIAVEIVDRADRIAAFLPRLDAMVGEGLVTLETVQVLTYRHGERPA